MVSGSTSCPLCGGTMLLTAVETPTWRVRACESCTNAWTEPAPGSIDYAAANFHEKTASRRGEGKTFGNLPPQWQKSRDMQVGLLQRYLPSGAKVLEIGCGEGILLERLAGSGFAVTGIEPSQTASGNARAAGLNVVTGYFPHAHITGKFDCVILSHVLEHLENPREILERACAIAPRILLVQTHWLGVMPQRYRDKWYAWLPEQHFWHFTPRGLETLLTPMNYRTEAVEYSSLVHTRPDGTLNQFSTVALSTPSGGDQFHHLFQRAER